MHKERRVSVTGTEYPLYGQETDDKPLLVLRFETPGRRFSLCPANPELRQAIEPFTGPMTTFNNRGILDDTLACALAGYAKGVRDTLSKAA